MELQSNGNGVASGSGNGNGDPSSSQAIESHRDMRSLGGNGLDTNNGSISSENAVGRAPLEDPDEANFKPMFDGSSIDRREFIRLTLQSLKDLGYQ